LIVSRRRAGITRYLPRALMTPSKPRVIVVGGGFGGLYATQARDDRPPRGRGPDREVRVQRLRGMAYVAVRAPDVYRRIREPTSRARAVVLELRHVEPKCPP